MDTALTFEELKPRMAVPRQVLGLAAVILAGTAGTPMNMHAIQDVADFSALNTTQMSVKQMEEILNAEAKNLKNMEQYNGADVFSINSVNDGAASKQKQSMKTRENIIASALLWQGVTYRLGGTTRSGIDCSALVQLVFRENGIQLTRGSYEQFREGVGIPKSKLERGDLVFFNTNGSHASHVGIYMGDSQFISATKNGVEIQSLDMPYWAGTYHASRRVIQ